MGKSWTEMWEDLSVGHGEFFGGIIKLCECKTIVEVGVAKGTTTKHLCEAVVKTGGFVYGFDLFDAHGQNKQFGRISTKIEVENYLNGFHNFKIYKIDTFSDSFKKLIDDIGKIDFAFIDGDHSYDGVLNDFNVIYPNLSEGGIIVFHDTLRIDGCREFMIDLRTKFNDGTFDVIDLPWGNLDRKTGVSLLVKRTFPTLDMEIDESCGSLSDYDTIYEKEKEWYSGQIKNKNNEILEKFYPLSSNGYKTIEYATELTKNSKYRHVLEFGVYKGITIDIIRNMLPLDFNVYGFDTFTGLPEDWIDPNGEVAGSGACKSGFFSTDGVIPNVKNVTFFEGLFKDTLNDYLKVAEPIALIHMDCDLYSSTKDVLYTLNSFIMKDTIISFDEWFYNSDGKYYADHEQKAFYEWVVDYGREFEFVKLPHDYIKRESQQHLTERKIVKIIK